MEMSEQINEISKAISAAQGELKNAVCDTKAHGYNYAKLVQYIDIAKSVLPKYGLAVSQFVESSDSDKIKVTTLLCHESGQWFKAFAVAPDAVLMGGAGKNPVQVAGSQITYMRRYQYAAILGMTDNAEDNDAQGLASPPKPKQAQPQPQFITRQEFEACKHKLAAEAHAMGAGGVEKVIAKTGKQWSESAVKALQDIVIEVAKSKQRTESGLVDGTIEVRSNV